MEFIKFKEKKKEGTIQNFPGGGRGGTSLFRGQKMREINPWDGGPAKVLVYAKKGEGTSSPSPSPGKKSAKVGSWKVSNILIQISIRGKGRKKNK